MYKKNYAYSFVRCLIFIPNLKRNNNKKKRGNNKKGLLDFDTVVSTRQSTFSLQPHHFVLKLVNVTSSTCQMKGWVHFVMSLGHRVTILVEDYHHWSYNSQVTRTHTWRENRKKKIPPYHHWHWLWTDKLYFFLPLVSLFTK